jgi:hypothetical protein
VWGFRRELPLLFCIRQIIVTFLDFQSPDAQDDVGYPFEDADRREMPFFFFFCMQRSGGFRKAVEFSLA